MSEFDKMVILRKHKMEDCDHLFVKREEGFVARGCHSSDYEYIPSVVICLKCGLNNIHRFKEYDDKLDRVNDEVFKKQFSYNDHRDPNYNLISNEVFRTFNEPTLYRIATCINSEASTEEIFNMMKELSIIEREEGRININNEEVLNRLKSRLCNNKRLVKNKSTNL